MSEVKNPILEYADQYRAEAGRGQKLADIWSVVTDLERNMAPLWDAQRLRADTAEAELAKLRALSVTNIMLDIVPGDGSGHEVYARSVDEVVAALSKDCERIEDMEGDIVTLQAKLDRAVELLRGCHTGDLFGPEGYELVEGFLSTASPATINQQGEECPEPKCSNGGEHGPWADNSTYCTTCGYYDKSRAEED